MAATTKPAPKAKADPTICRWGKGRYLSPANAKACANPKAPKRELCADHEVAYRAAKKKAGASARQSHAEATATVS